MRVAIMGLYGGFPGNGTWSLPPQTNLPSSHTIKIIGPAGGIPIKVDPNAKAPHFEAPDLSKLKIKLPGEIESIPITFMYGADPALFESNYPYLHQITPRACYLCLKGTEFEFVSSAANRIPVCNHCLETEFNYVRIGDDFVKDGEGGLRLPVK